MTALSNTGETTRDGLLARGVVLSIAALIHLAVVAAFLAKIHVGLPVYLRNVAHPSDTLTPIVASILPQGTQGGARTESRFPGLQANQLTSLSQNIDIPTPAPVWPSELDLGARATQPAPSVGRTGLHCEIHIHQNLAGRVQAIDFGECTGDRIWQHTLLQTLERAAQLVEPPPDARFPPVRTLTVGTDNLSPTVLAQQLSTTEMFEKQTNSEGPQ